MVLQALYFSKDKKSVKVLDQTKLPLETVYEDVKNAEDGWHSIKSMKVRGAPAIAICAAMALSVGSRNYFPIPSSIKEMVEKINQDIDHLVTSRPTAVNLYNMSVQLKDKIKEWSNEKTITVEKIVDNLYDFAVKLEQDDVKANMQMGFFGGEEIIKGLDKDRKAVILTHCNTGSLATARYGTALGVVRYLNDNNALERLYFCEARPYNQGSRLTAYECVEDNIPGTLICDSMVSYLFKTHRIDAVFVGADRVVSNGDTANKIGTYQIAITAKYHGVPFYIVSPTTTIDLSKKTGNDIKIEYRPKSEILTLMDHVIAPKDIDAWNPSFDLTPSSLITGIVTEFGIVKQDKDGNYDLKSFLSDIKK